MNNRLRIDELRAFGDRTGSGRRGIGPLGDVDAELVLIVPRFDGVTRLEALSVFFVSQFLQHGLVLEEVRMVALILAQTFGFAARPAHFQIDADQLTKDAIEVRVVGGRKKCGKVRLTCFLPARSNSLTQRSKSGNESRPGVLGMGRFRDKLLKNSTTFLKNSFNRSFGTSALPSDFLVVVAFEPPTCDLTMERR